MANITRTDFSFLSSDKIHNIDCFRVAGEKPKAILIIEHGIAEHKERYVKFAEIMVENGYAVFADDHLGHGKSVNSPDELVWFAEKDGWNSVCFDVVTLISKAKEEYPDLPIILMGHSMGSFIARTVAIKHSDMIDILVLSGTGHQSGMIIKAGSLIAKTEKKKKGSKGKSELIENLAFGAYNKKFAPNRTTHDWLSRDNAEVDKYIADPLSGNPTSIGIFLDMLSGLDFIRKPKNIEKIRKDLPIYMLSGDKDPVGGMSKGVKTVYRLYKKCGMENVTLKLYREGRHELLNGPDRDLVIKELNEWLEKELEK